MITDGDIYEDVCCVPENKEDAVYFIVKRTIGGVQKRYIERMSNVNSTFLLPVYLDSYKTFDGRNTSGKTLTITGSTYLYDDTLTLTASSSQFSASDATYGNMYRVKSGSE